MTASWDPNRGQLVYGKDETGEDILDPMQAAGVTPEDEDPFGDIRRLDESQVEYDVRMLNKRQRQETREAAAQEYVKDEDKPFISGKTLTDIPKAAANAIPAFVTDILDLGLAGYDLVSETGKATFDPDYDFNWRNIADDSDNPLTQWRRDTFVPGGFDTKAGEITNLGLRLAGDVVGFKWLLKTPMVANRLRKLGKLVGILKTPSTSAAATAIKTGRVAKQLSNVKTTSRGVAKAGKIAGKNDYLASTFETISKLRPVSKSEDLTGWWKRTVVAARVYAKDKITPKTIAETIAWDSFAAFNVMGEGDDMMDETIFDAAQEMGLANPLASDPLDSALWRKVKGFADASLVGIAGGGIVDLIRIKRFKDAIKKADPKERAKLVKAFSEDADEMGRGIAGLLPQSGDTTTVTKYTSQQLQKQQASQIFDRLEDSRREIDEFERIQADAIAKTQRALEPPGALATQRDVQQAPKGLLPSGVADEGDSLTQGALREGRSDQYGIPASMPNPFQDGKGFIAEGSRVRAIEPTISPEGIRVFSREMLQAGFSPQEVKRAITSSLPRKRVDLIEYMQQGLSVSEEGVINAADSVWSNYITELGLSEGWARIDPVTAELRFIRSAAASADQSALINKQAEALDELQGLLFRKQQDEKMQAARLDREQVQPTTTPVDSQQAGQLADAELARTAGREADEALARSGLDPAIQDAEVKTVDASLDAQALQQQEIARMADEVTAVNPDSQVRELLGVDPDDIELTIEKSPEGRGWVVIDSQGEQLGERFTTKRAAQRKVDAEKKRLKADLQKRAQQVADDQEGTVANFGRRDPARSSNLTGTVELTQPQLRELSNFPSFKESLEKTAGKKFEFTQEKMSEFITEARTVMAYGVDGRRARMLKTLIDKFDNSVKLLEPEARRQREIDAMLEETNRYLDHGDFCK